MSARIVPLSPTACAAVAPPPPPPATEAHSKAEWVRAYAAAGWHPLVLRPNDKRPLREGWQTATLEQILTDLAGCPEANIGISPPPGCFVLDVDVKNGADGFAMLQAYAFSGEALPATLSARTRGGGAHMVFSLPEGQDLPNAVRFAPGLDIRMSGKGYIVAEPSTIDGRPYRWENWGASIAPAPLWLPAAILAGKATEKLPADVDIPFPEGGRNDALTRKAGVMRNAGFAEDEIYEAISALNDRKCSPPLPSGEVAAIAKSVARYSAAAEPWEVFGQSGVLPPGASLERPANAVPEGLGTIVALDVQENPFAPLPHYVDKWIPQDEVTLLAGHGGGGKSYVALSMAVHIALGRPFGPLLTRQANVLFYSAEDGARVLRSRLARICRGLGIEAAQLAGKLILLDASDIEPALFRKAELPTLARLAAEMAKHNAELVVIDNASDAFDGDEIRRAEVRGFIRSLRFRLARPGRAVLLLAHINKGSANGGKSAGAEDYSGSTAWHNSVRSRLSLNPGGSDSLTIDHMKANHGPKAAPVRLEWRDGVPVVVSGVLVDYVAEADRRAEHKRALVAVIQRIEQRGARVPTTRHGGCSTFKTLEGDAAFPPGLVKEQFYRLMDELQDEGRVFRKEVRIDSKPKEIFSCLP